MGDPSFVQWLKKGLMEEAHGIGHVGTAQVERNLYHRYIRDMVKEFVRRCLVCRRYNPQPTVRPELGKFPLLQQPGKEVIIDYTDMGERVRGFKYLLVCVDGLTGWPEVWPTRNEDSKSVIKCLVSLEGKGK